MIHREVIISCLNHSLTDSLVLSTHHIGQIAPRQGLEGIARSWETYLYTQNTNCATDFVPLQEVVWEL